MRALTNVSRAELEERLVVFVIYNCLYDAEMSEFEVALRGRH